MPGIWKILLQAADEWSTTWLQRGLRWGVTGLSADIEY